MNLVFSRLRAYVNDLSLEAGRSITHQEIAEQSGIQRPTVTNWMKNREPMTFISVDTLIKLSDYLGLENPFELLEVIEVSEDDSEGQTENSLAGALEVA